MVTGDLTVGAGFMDGDWVAENNQMQGSYSAVGAKYVSGDITFNVGASAGNAKDEEIGGAGNKLVKTQLT